MGFLHQKTNDALNKLVDPFSLAPPSNLPKLADKLLEAGMSSKEEDKNLRDDLVNKINLISKEFNTK